MDKISKSQVAGGDITKSQNSNDINKIKKETFFISLIVSIISSLVTTVIVDFFK